MKPILALITILAVSSLACGVMATMPVLPTVTPHPTNAPTRQQEAPSATPAVKPTQTHEPAPLVILGGCWNIREGAGIEYAVVRVQCGGELIPLAWSVNGFVQVDGGYICNRAFGLNKECK